MKILMVDDTPDLVSRFYRDAVTQGGQEFDTAGRWRMHSLGWLTSPNVVLIDLMMDDMPETLRACTA